jgi:predicted nucleic acid-binding protein
LNPVILDSGPLGLLSNPKISPAGVACNEWLNDLLDRDRRVIIPGIVDYEIRRELLRAGKVVGLRRLEELREQLEFLPITQTALFRAAELWAEVRQRGLTTAADAALDGDCILAAQVLLLNEPDAIIATLNVSHLSRFTTAALWHEIS